MPEESDFEPEVDKSGDQNDECDEFKLPPLETAKHSGKPTSSKSSTESLRLKSPKYTIWDRSNVQSVLTDYGYHPTGTPLLQRPDKLERQHTVNKSFSFDGSDVLKEQERRRSRKEYYLKIYKDIHRLRDYCRDEYFEKLEEKVEKQRKNIQKKRSVSFANPLGKQPTQKRYFVSKIFRKPKREAFLARHYLRNVPKSEHYKIIELEDKLRAEGKLKTQADVDEFWCNMQKTLASNPAVPVSLVATLSNPMHHGMMAEPPSSIKPLGKILEYWATPSLGNIKKKNATGAVKGTKSSQLTGKKEDDAFHLARKAAVELDRKHPQMGIPPLHCFYMDLEEKPRDPEDQMRERLGVKHSKERLLFIKRLHRMYSLANANNASTQRIMEKRMTTEVIPFQAGCFTVSDLISEEAMNPSVDEPASLEETHPWMKHVGVWMRGNERKREITPIEELSEGGTPERTRSHTSAKSEKSSLCERSMSVEVQDTVPLCWESLVREDDIRILEPKTPCFYWINYMGAGQKVSL